MGCLKKSEQLQGFIRKNSRGFIESLLRFYIAKENRNMGVVGQQKCQAVGIDFK